MSIEPICDFCGASDKFRCKTVMAAAGCESYREQNRIRESIERPHALTQHGTVSGRVSHTKPNMESQPKAGQEISITVQGPNGPITVMECGTKILVKRDDDQIAVDPDEAVEMVAALKQIIQFRK